MAVLANVQREALGGVGAGVIQRYYAAACATPGLVFGRLIRNTQYHIDKIRSKKDGLARFFNQTWPKSAATSAMRSRRLFHLKNKAFLPSASISKWPGRKDVSGGHKTMAVDPTPLKTTPRRTHNELACHLQSL